MVYNYKSELFNYSKSFSKNAVKWINSYIKFIERCKSRSWSNDDGPFETHHIVPKSWGGLDCDENLIKLPILYHMIAHCYLYHTHDVHMVNAFSHMFTTRNLEFQNNYFIRTAADCRRLVILNRGRRIVNLTTGKIYASIRDATKHSGLRFPSTIRNAIEWNLPVLATGQYWQYEDCLTEESYDKEIEKFKRIREEKDRQILLAKKDRARTRRRKIINLTTNVVYESSEIVQDTFNVTAGSILDAIRHHTKMVDCYWMYYDEFDTTLGTAHYLNAFESIAQTRSSRQKTAVIDTTTNTRYASMKEAAKAMNVHPNAIAEAVKTGHKCCGHLWIIEGGKQRDLRVVEMSSMQVYNTKKEASEKTGISKNSITRSTLTDKPVKGTLWKNFNELDPQIQKQLLK